MVYDPIIDRLSMDERNFLLDHGMRDVVNCPTCKKGHIVIIMKRQYEIFKGIRLYEYTLNNGDIVREKFEDGRVILDNFPPIS